MEILIIKLSAIGDVVHTLPALASLHHQFPESNITWVVEEKASDIVKDHPYLKKLIVSKRKKWLQDLRKPSLWYPILKEIVSLVRELRSQEYDIVIDFQGLLKSAILVFLSRGKRKIGYSKTREMSSLFLSEKIADHSRDQHAVDRNVNLSSYLGAQRNEIKFPIFIGEEDKKKVKLLFSTHRISSSRPLIAIHAQAGWMTKGWNPKKVAKLSEQLIEIYNAQIIFIGGKDDCLSIEHIISMMSYSAVNLAGKTSLKELAYLASLLNLMITVDSGPMHLASAMGTSIIVLFGPTAPWKTGPYGNNAIVIRSRISCSPCFKRKCDSRACMEGISVEAVLQGVGTQLRPRSFNS